MDNEENETITFKDAAVAAVVVPTVIIGVGALAKLGWDLADEGLRKFKNRKNEK
jgi:hypothetical protein